MNFLNSWLLGLIGPIDKEQQIQLFKLSENGLVLSFILNVIALIISIAIDLFNQQLTFQTVLIYVMLIIISGYIATKVSRKDVSQYEVYSKKELANLRKRLRLISGLQTFYSFLVFNLIYTMGVSYLLNEKIDFGDLIAPGLFSLFIGFFTYLFNISKIVKEF